MSRFRTSHAKSSSIEIPAGSYPSNSPGKHGIKKSPLSVPHIDFYSKNIQSKEYITSGDSLSECQAGPSIGLPSKPSCSGAVFKASPSRRQVKAVIFERGGDGEPTVTVIMTREPSW